MKRALICAAGAAAFSAAALAQPVSTQSPTSPTQVVLGTVQTVQAGRGLVSVAPSQPGQMVRHVQATAQTIIVRQVRTPLSQLKVGDRLTVTGVPLQMEAVRIQLSDEPAAPGSPPGSPPPAGGPAARPSNPAQTALNSRVEGQVLSLSPLVLALPGNRKVEVKADPQTPVTRTVRSSLADLKIGEPILAFTRMNPDGSLEATRIQAGEEGFPIRLRPSSPPPRTPPK